MTRLLWLGLLEGPSGYADEARAYLRALEAAGHEPAAREALRDGGDARLSGSERAMLAAQSARASDPAIGVAVHHYAPAWVRTPLEVEGVANVARTMFETDGVPRAWVEQLLRRDEVWVPSEHARAAFERGGLPSSRLRVVGQTVDFDLYAPGVEPLELADVPSSHRVFLSNFAFSERKAWRELLAAWARAFDPADPVCLVLKTTARRGEGALRARVEAAVADAARAAGRSATAPVRVMTDTLAPRDLARLYAAADAYVLASRGEGWGRPYMEAMAMGLPTIASRWSGNLAFMSDETSWLVDGELVPVPDNHETFADDVSGHRWFQPDVEAYAAALSEIAAHFAAAREKAGRARPDLLERFGPEVVAAQITAAADEAASRARTLGRSVRLRGPFGRNASLALVNDRLLSGLEDAGRRVHARHQGATVEPGAETVISHSWPPDFSAACDGPSVVILPWEYGDPPREWVRRANAEIDRVVVPSEYVREGYVAAGMPPGAVAVVPNGVDLDIFTPSGPVFELERSAACTFLFVGGTIWRKGVDLLLEAWVRAFGPDDDVQLVIKDFGAGSHYKGQTAEAAITAAASHPDAAPIVHLTEHLAPAELPALYRAADVLVAPYRGEGFGLPILEAMACGVPPIHTAQGPSREFAPAGAGWAVDATRVSLASRSGGLPELAGEGYVHEVRIDALVSALRAAAADPAERSRRGELAARAAREFSWPAVSGRLEAVLAEVEAEALPPARTVGMLKLDAHPTAVLYTPDWADVPTAVAAIAAWARAVPADAPVSLVLPAVEDDAEAIVEQVLEGLAAHGIAEDALPDLVVHQTPAGRDDTAALVAAVDAVLLDDAQAAAPPARLCRRAKRVLRPADAAAFVSALEPAAALRAA